MKTALVFLLLSFSALSGNTYLTPSIEQIEKDSDLIVIGSIERIKITKERKLGSKEPAEKEITIFVHTTIRGKAKENKITIRHTYDGTNLEALRAATEKVIKEVEELELLYAEKSENSDKFRDSKEGIELRANLDVRQNQVMPLLKHNFRPTPFDIPDSWQPSKDDKFLVFLEKRGKEYRIPKGSFHFRRLSYLRELPKHAIEIK